MKHNWFALWVLVLTVMLENAYAADRRRVSFVHSSSSALVRQLQLEQSCRDQGLSMFRQWFYLGMPEFEKAGAHYVAWANQKLFFYLEQCGTAYMPMEKIASNLFKAVQSGGHRLERILAYGQAGYVHVHRPKLLLEWCRLQPYRCTIPTLSKHLVGLHAR